MRINQNIAAFNAYRNLSQTQGAQSKSLEKLSSGFRINRAADDASGLVNSENLRSQIGGLKVATRNAQDAISLVQTAEGAQTEVHSILQRMRDLVVQSGNLGTNDDASLKANNDEIAELKNELNRIAEQTQFGTKSILSGNVKSAGDGVAAVAWDTDLATTQGDLQAALAAEFGGAAGDYDLDAITANVGGEQVTLNDLIGADGSDLANLTATTQLTLSGSQSFTFQVGANAGQQVSVDISSVRASELGKDVAGSQFASVDAISLTGADSTTIDDALKVLDEAISGVSDNRATLGAFQNRMESTIRNVSVAVENLSAAESRIRDTDMAEEMVNFTRNQILSQAGTAMLAQANQVPQSVLSLLR